MTQERTAELISINVTYLSDIDRDKRYVSLLHLARLAEAYGKNFEDVLRQP